MIDKLVYVSCDRCGSFPTTPVVGRARDARQQARAEGYVRRGGLDICPACQADEKAAR